MSLRVFTRCETEITASPDASLRLVDGILEIVNDSRIIRMDDASVIVAKASSELRTAEETYPRLAA
jgi:hypothetical protein